MYKNAPVHLTPLTVIEFFLCGTVREAEEKRNAYLYELEYPIIKAKQNIEEWEEIHENEVTYKT